MDMIKIANIFALFIPFLLALYFIISRIKLNLVNKKILNNALILSSVLPFFVFLSDYFIFLKQSNILLFNCKFISIKNTLSHISFSINNDNILFLIYSSILFVVLSIFLKNYFKNKKQFIFVKQRYTTFLTIFIFNLYLFLTSDNLFTGGIFWVFSGFLSFIFCYFDLFKNSTKTNITRFYRITILGDFALFFACLIFFKYSIVSSGYINSTSLNYNDFNILASYAFGISDFIEFKICFIALFFAILTKFVIYPFSSYYSFLANSSNIIYLPIFIINNIFGLFLFTQIADIFELFNSSNLILITILSTTLFLSFIFILFEKNIKIIFGYIISMLNSIFLICYFMLDKTYSIYGYFALFFIAICTLIIFFSKNKIDFSKRIINKQKGFWIEKLNIILFENLPLILFKTINFIDEKIIQNLSNLFIYLFNFIAKLFNFKFYKINKFDIIKFILYTFAIFSIITIFIALFGDFKF